MKLLSLMNPKNGVSHTLGSDASPEMSLSLKGVVQVMEHFRIGSRLQYYPEYQKEKKIDTVIVAYVVNDFVIYSNRDIQTSEVDSRSEAMEILQKGARVPMERLFNFNILIPHISRKEIDFKVETNKEAGQPIVPTEKNANDFRRGNSITLFCKGPKAKGMFHIDTEVKKNIVLNSGLYSMKNR